MYMQDKNTFSMKSVSYNLYEKIQDFNDTIMQCNFHYFASNKFYGLFYSELNTIKLRL